MPPFGVANSPLQHQTLPLLGKRGTCSGDDMTFSRCSEMRCHSERSEESRPTLSGAVCPTQSKIPRFARNDISWFLGAFQPTGMSDCGCPFIKSEFII